MKANKMLNNANKVAYLVQQYPEHKLEQIVALLGMPAIDINTAVWYAVEVGFITEPNKETGKIELAKPPKTWDFGPDYDSLEDMMLYAFQKTAKQETDLEEHYVSNWTLGHTSHDVIIAMLRLLEDKKIAKYVIEDGENPYTFYTLYENREKLWGRKQFKHDPLDPNTDTRAMENGEDGQSDDKS